MTRSNASVLELGVTNNEIPEALRAAIAEHHAKHGPPRRPEQRPVRRGDFALVYADGTSSYPVCDTSLREPVQRIMLVANVRDDAVTAYLCSNEIEAATDFDLIVRDSLPFAVIVERELYGCVDHDQFNGVVGTLDSERMDAVSKALHTDAESLKRWERGLPLSPFPSDWRRTWKEQELSVLQTLTAACTSRLLAEAGI